MPVIGTVEKLECRVCKEFVKIKYVGVSIHGPTCSRCLGPLALKNRYAREDGTITIVTCERKEGKRVTIEKMDETMMVKALRRVNLI